jgi:outer membrane protein, heavy metal efflux system
MTTKTTLLILLLTASFAPAGELQHYLMEAAQNNPGLEAAFNRWKAALEKIPQVKALPDPRFTYSYFIEEVETRVGPQEQRFAISQTFPWFGKLDLRGDIATAAAEAERQRYEQEKLDLFYRVKSAFYEYAYLAQSIETSRRHLRLLENIEEIARARLKSGAPQNAAVQAQVELGKLEDRLQTLEAMRIPLSAQLSAALNRSRNAPLLPQPESINKTGGEFTDADVLSILSGTSPQLKQLEAQIRKEEAAVDLAHKSRLPDLTFGLSYIQTGEARMPGVSDSGKDPLMASVSVNLPIWFGKLKAEKQEAAFRRVAAQEQHTETRNRLEAGLQTALFRFRDAERKIRLYRDTLIPKAEQSLEVTRESFETGSDSFTALIDAERTLLEFRLSADRALADREIRLAEIEKLTGTQPRK